MALTLRPAVPADASAVQACVDAAFEGYIERIGRPPASTLLDFEAEIRAGRVWLAKQAARVVGSIVQYPIEQGLHIDTVAASAKSGRFPCDRP